MYQSINEYDFRRAFEDMGRRDQFSYEALNLIFDYFENIEGETGEQIKLDVIAICCDYSEDTYDNIASNYSIEDLEDLSIEDRKQAIEDFLNDRTILLGQSTDNSLVYLQF